jgi:hypothetical protein
MNCVRTIFSLSRIAAAGLCVTLAGLVLHAQASTPTIVGTWQGTLTLPSGTTVRVAFSIARNPDGSFPHNNRRLL